MLGGEEHADVPAPGVAEPVDGPAHGERAEHFTGGKGTVRQGVRPGRGVAAPVARAVDGDEGPGGGQCWSQPGPGGGVDEQAVPEQCRGTGPLDLDMQPADPGGHVRHLFYLPRAR
ncbi:hypothetical protein Asi02nite_63690 [Asanoa siamensis]|uniref:Uncharacterized protein n=1 Tax=Asanoa siamensis TaxID=926357 RepID=A0ABQ4D009_9ACTN|nr:hypothetical protein Asi02nite_63690 [Asanoa siamensis]